MFMKWRKPETSLPWSGLHVSNRKRIMDSLKEWHRDLRLPRYMNELRKVAKAEAFLPLEIFAKGLEPPLWNSVWQLLIAGDPPPPPFKRNFGPPSLPDIGTDGLATQG